MAVVLAIEPDPRQAAILKRVVRERAHAEICVVDTKDAAIAAMGSHPPELILLTALLSPRDEEELVVHLRTLDGADHLQTLTIPLLGPATADGDEDGGFLRKAFKGKKKKRGQAHGCDPWTFAEEVAGYLKAAAEAKAEREWRAERQAGTPTSATTFATPSTSASAKTDAAAQAWTLEIEAPEPPPLRNAAAFAAAQEAPAPDTPVEPVIYEWPTADAVSESGQPDPVAEILLEAPPAPIEIAVPEGTVFSSEPMPIVEPDAAVAEPDAETELAAVPEREPIVVVEAQPVTADASEPIEAAPEPIVLATTAPALEAPELEPDLTPVMVVDAPPAMEETAAVDVPEPIYLTSPDRVFDEIPVDVESASLEPADFPEAVPPVMYRPLKRLPPLATWARVEMIAATDAALPPELAPESDTAGVLSNLRVPAHALPVTYPRRPHIRYVRAA